MAACGWCGEPAVQQVPLLHEDSNEEDVRVYACGPCGERLVRGPRRTGAPAQVRGG